MKSFADFKKELGVETINFYQGKGREFATVGTTDIIISKTCDVTQPLFVIPLSKDGVEIADAFVVCNSTVAFARSL